MNNDEIDKEIDAIPAAADKIVPLHDKLFSELHKDFHTDTIRCMFLSLALMRIVEHFPLHKAKEMVQDQFALIAKTITTGEHTFGEEDDE